jgi:hypothetical protein
MVPMEYLRRGLGILIHEKNPKSRKSRVRLPLKTNKGLTFKFMNLLLQMEGRQEQAVYAHTRGRRYQESRSW